MRSTNVSGLVLSDISPEIDTESKKSMWQDDIHGDFEVEERRPFLSAFLQSSLPHEVISDIR
jgi:hypothetical protein